MAIALDSSYTGTTEASRPGGGAERKLLLLLGHYGELSAFFFRGAS